MPVTTQQLIAEGKLRSLDVVTWAKDPRRTDMAERLAIDRGDYHDLATKWIRERYKQPEVVNEMVKFIDQSLNLLQRVADRLAVAYKISPSRRIGSRKTDTDKWQKVMKEGRVASLAKQWGRYAFITNVHFVVPYVAETIESGRLEKRLRFETVLPDRVVRAFFGDDPRWPDVIVYEHQDRAEEHAFAVGPSHEKPCYVALDSEGWTYLDRNWRVLEFRTHGTGHKIHVPCRVAEGQPNDFWDRHRGRKLVTSTLEVQRIWAAMSYVRHHQNRKLMVVIAQSLSGVLDGQVVTPETGLVAEAEQGGLDIKIHDFSQPITDFEAELRFRTEVVAEAYGVPSGFIDLNGAKAEGTDSALGHAKGHAALSEIRDAQIEPLREFESNLAFAIALVLQAARHPLAIDPDRVREEFEVSWPPLTFVEHPLVQLQVAAERMKIGMGDHATVYQEMHPWLTIEQCQGRVMEHITRRNEFNRHLAVHNQPKDPREEGETLSAEQGRVGGQSRRPSEGVGDEDEVA